MRRLFSLSRAERGSATVELALVAPILAVMFLGLIDISKAYSDKLVLEQVAQRITEKVMQKGFVTTDETTLETEATTAAPGATADVTYWMECNGTKMTGTTAWTDGCTAGQSYARYVQVVMSKSITPIILTPLAGARMNGAITVTGTSGVRIQ